MRNRDSESSWPWIRDPGWKNYDPRSVGSFASISYNSRQADIHVQTETNKIMNENCKVRLNIDPSVTQKPAFQRRRSSPSSVTLFSETHANTSPLANKGKTLTCFADRRKLKREERKVIIYAFCVILRNRCLGSVKDKKIRESILGLKQKRHIK